MLPEKRKLILFIINAAKGRPQLRSGTEGTQDSPPRRGACRGLTAHPAPSPSLRRRPTHLVIVQARLQDLVELAGQRVGAGGRGEPRGGGGGRRRRRGGVGHGCGLPRPQRRPRSGSGGNAPRAFGSGPRAGPRLVQGGTRRFAVYFFVCFYW